MSGRSLAIKRINKDMKEINKYPVEGIGIASLENDPMKYVVNIKLMSGPYKDYCVQLLLTFPETFPSKPPKMLIYPDQAIDGQYHHHIFQDYLQDENHHYFKKFCFDLLDNDFMSIKEENTGWNPSYTISSILLQVQNFISDPDMHGYIPNQNKIKQLFDSMKTYKRKFKTVNDEGKLVVIEHTWTKPFPEMYVKKDEDDKKDDKKNETEEKEKIRMQQIKDNLTCFMLKLNYIDDPDILLGYPIIQNKTLGAKPKIELYPIPELLTYDGYMAQIGKQDDKLDFYFDIKFKSANNQFYNYWVPIYIDEHHYKKNKPAILNSFSVIKFGPRGIKEYDFVPEQIFEILPNLLNKMIIGMFNGKTSICSSFIRCYFQYVLLFKKLCLEYEEEYSNYVNHILNLIKKNDYSPDKNIVPDIGDLFMLLFFSNKDTHTPKMKKMWYVLFEELTIRQAYWIFHEYNNKYMMLKIIGESDLYFQNYEDDSSVKIKDNKILIEDLKEKKLLDEIIDIYLSDAGFGNNYDPKVDNEKNILKIINDSFDNFYYNHCSEKAKKSIRQLITLNLDFSKYLNKKLDISHDFCSYKNELYETFKVDQLLKKLNKDTLKKVLRYSFDSQKGNKLLIITFFTQKKIEDKEFIRELQNNYGIYLDVDVFIKDMNQQIENIHSYHDFFNYIGSDFGKDMDDLEILTHCYQMAIKKNYIRANNFNISQNFIGRGRGRGGFIGGRGRGEFIGGRGRGEFRGGRGRGEFRGGRGGRGRGRGG